jgi:serine/threonine protein phosphatase PrpC
LTSKSLDIAAAVGHSADHSLPCQGTTCLVALFCGDTLCVGNVGDTRAFVAGKNGIKTLSTIHNLTNEEERLRILKAGGEVVELPNGILRVNGQLTLTRTLGCTCFRKFGVLTNCDTSENLLSKDDAFLLLATDGL